MAMSSFLWEMILCMPAIMLCLTEKKNPVPAMPERDQLFCVRNQEKRTRELHSGQLHFLLQLHNTLAKCAICIHKILYRLAGVDNSSVIAATEMFSNGL
jgi:hypothetical protein